MNNTAYGNTFKRKELKYVLDCKKYNAVLNKIKEHMTEDKYGNHTICNIYFDNESSQLIRTSISKPLYKEKLRLRCYGVPNDDTIAFLEIKKKFKGVVYKRREQLTYINAADWFFKGAPPPKTSQVISEVEFMINRYSLKPEIVICYDRHAFYGNEDKEFRVTFDSNIRSRTNDLDLRNGDYGEPLVGQPYSVMEIKVDTAMPMWMTEILSELQIYKQSFSKYGSIFINSCDIQDRRITFDKIPNNKERESKNKCFQV